MVLARELSLGQIQEIAERTTATLEFFIHGALCVSYSGQCYLSHARTGRSANRGECSQACRLPYSLADQQGQILADQQGQILAKDTHLLSLKDNNQAANLQALIDAGIRSFKIEGRLKDLSYVKNVTAYYREQLDVILAGSPELRRSSSGRCIFFFTPNPDKSFNRGATDYFLRQRNADIGAFDSPKFVGEKVGTVSNLTHHSFDVETTLTLNNGDGLTYFKAGNELAGLRINLAERNEGGYRLFPASNEGKQSHGLKVGTAIYRNHDQTFERQLEKKSAERRIPLSLRLEETNDGFALHMEDDAGVSAVARLVHVKDAAQNGERAEASLRENLGKLGNTIYVAETIDLALSSPRFIPASALNGLRRAAIDAIDTARQVARQRSTRRPAVVPPATYPEDTLSYLGNVYNQKARAFYEKHGVRMIEPAFECGSEKGEVSLMITKHCLRYSVNLCPKQVKGIRPDPLALINGNDKLTLRFDCKRCEMHVLGRLSKHRTVPLRVAEK